MLQDMSVNGRMRVTIKPRWNSEYAASDINFDLLTHWELVTYIYTSANSVAIVAGTGSTLISRIPELKEIFDQNTKMLFRENAFEKVVCKRSALLFRTQCVKPVNMASQSNPLYTGCGHVYSSHFHWPIGPAWWRHQMETFSA